MGSKFYELIVSEELDLIKEILNKSSFKKDPSFAKCAYLFNYSEEKNNQKFLICGPYHLSSGRKYNIEIETGKNTNKIKSILEDLTGVSLKLNYKHRKMVYGPSPKKKIKFK